MPENKSSEELIASVGHNIQEKAAVIWAVADTLRGAYKAQDYRKVILPMAVIKRLHDCLLPTHDAVVAKFKQIQKMQVKDPLLMAVSKYRFYNTSPFTFETLKADPENIADNFKAYLTGFSDDIQDILTRMQFYAQVDIMQEAGCLYQVICEFSTERADMSPDKISAVDMGYIFEELVRRFSEDTDNGEHFTSRDIIYLMCDLLVHEEKQCIQDESFVRTVYDMAMGTSQMLSCMEERLKQYSTNANIACFGQEVSPETFAIAKSDMLIRGGNTSNMRFGDTLSNDRFDGFTFDYCISNPPFGIDWKKEAKAVEDEAKRGADGRFGAGLPSKSDGQMLFMLNGLSKLKDNGRMAIIQNGSSLFTGDAGSGQSDIRKYLIENDWLDTIIQLPNDSFTNTGIATYVWILIKSKPEAHKGKVQLIDASGCYEARRKSIGNKRVDITDACRELILKVYDEFKAGRYEANTAEGKTILCKSKIMDNASLGYSKITVESPLLDEDGKAIMKNGKKVADSSKRDTENVPLTEDIKTYFEREVLPYKPDAWIDATKTKIGYEIPFTRVFYEYKKIESASDIAARIEEHERALLDKLHKLFHGE